MPKLKTKKAVAKRIKLTKRNKALRSKAGRRHLLSSKTHRRKRVLRHKVVTRSTERTMIKRALPYGS